MCVCTHLGCESCSLPRPARPWLPVNPARPVAPCRAQPSNRTTSSQLTHRAQTPRPPQRRRGRRRPRFGQLIPDPAVAVSRPGHRCWAPSRCVRTGRRTQTYSLDPVYMCTGSCAAARVPLRPTDKCHCRSTHTIHLFIYSCENIHSRIRLAFYTLLRRKCIQPFIPPLRAGASPIFASVALPEQRSRAQDGRGERERERERVKHTHGERETEQRASLFVCVHVCLCTHSQAGAAGGGLRGRRAVHRRGDACAC